MTVSRERASTPADRAHLRTQQGLTQTQVANLFGMRRRYVCEIEAGKPSLYSDRLFRLLDLIDAGLVEGEDVA